MTKIPQVYDVNGTLRDWNWLIAKYGRIQWQQGLLYPCFKLIRIRETVGPASLKVTLLDANGNPMGALAALTYPDLVNPWSELPLITKGDLAKSMWSNRGVLQFADPNSGMTGFGLGSDSWIKDLAAGGPYHVWVFHTTAYSDCLSWLGWLGGTDHAGPMDVTFQWVNGTSEPEPDPEPGPDPEPTGDLLAEVKDMHATLKRLAAHLGA
jgi:hypothetical protein